MRIDLHIDESAVGGFDDRHGRIVIDTLFLDHGRVDIALAQTLLGIEITRVKHTRRLIGQADEHGLIDRRKIIFAVNRLGECLDLIGMGIGTICGQIIVIVIIVHVIDVIFDGKIAVSRNRGKAFTKENIVDFIRCFDQRRDRLKNKCLIGCGRAADQKGQKQNSRKKKRDLFHLFTSG